MRWVSARLASARLASARLASALLASARWVPARWALAPWALAIALLLSACPWVLAQSTPVPPERPAVAPEQTGSSREARERDDGEATKDDGEVNRVVPSRQLSALRAGLEQQLKELPPGKKADAIRRLLDQLSNAPQASEAKSTNRELPNREVPNREVPGREMPAGRGIPSQRTAVERMLAEIEFRVVLQQYEHILVRLRDGKVNGAEQIGFRSAHSFVLATNKPSRKPPTFAISEAVRMKYFKLKIGRAHV